MVGSQGPRVLFVDAYDSFSNNIVSLLESQLKVRVTKVYHDTDVVDLCEFLRPFAAVVAGPGPGTASNPADVGLIERLWTLPEFDLIPVFGICLGFQSLVSAYGGNVLRLPFARHGIATTITSSEQSIFRGCPEMHAVQYHSLHAVLEASRSDQDGPTTDWWSPRPSCPDLLPLAWDFDRAWELKAGGHDCVNLGAILMAVKHLRRPFYGIQFHPESVCSSAQARSIISNWWHKALEWLQIHKPPALPTRTFTSSVSRMSSPATSASAPGDDSDWGSSGSTPMTSRSNSSISLSSEMLQANPEGSPSVSRRVRFHCLPLGDLTVPILYDSLHLQGEDTVILDSEARQMPKLGVYSIVGLTDYNTINIKYYVKSGKVEIRHQGRSAVIPLDNATSIFRHLKGFLSNNAASDCPSDCPLWGGVLGYITYEAGLETIGIQACRQNERPDICFAFIERSLVIDHARDILYIQSIAENDSEWVDDTVSMLLRRQQDLRRSVIETPDRVKTQAISMKPPEVAAYKAKVRSCQSEIRAGNSYELCLTDQTIVTLSKDIDPWHLYLRQRQSNPAPFGAFVRLGPLTLLSTSPERFLCWTRPMLSPGDTAAACTCQFRPIKGTVQKRQTQANGSIRHVSIEEARAILSTRKEQAENLMIVDLIRHDLHGVVGSGNVDVTALMSVEEYESVYQLVSVIEGRLDIPKKPLSRTASDVDRPHGIDVLAASLPPGSMTGAPKKRACELLQGIEGGDPRSVYAGVLGYMCVGGGGDFSVVIRSAFRWDDPDAEFDEWRIGAGGAVTGLSTPDGEWEEMRAKLSSVLGMFSTPP